MLSLFQKIFQPADLAEVSTDERDFDRLMERVENDEMDLARLESQIHSEFAEIGGDVKNISQGVDRAMDK